MAAAGPEQPPLRDSSNQNSRPDSPPRPPISPITPVASYAKLVATGQLPASIPPAAPVSAPAPTRFSRDMAPMSESKVQQTQASPVGVKSAQQHHAQPLSQQASNPQPHVPQPQVSNLAAPPPPEVKSNQESNPGLHADSQQPIAQEEQKFVQRASPVPISEDDNTDVMALRAAISVLQVQRNKAKQDLQTLQQIKKAAVEDPQRFVDALNDGKLSHKVSKDDPLKPTFDSDNDDSDDGDDGDVDHMILSEPHNSSHIPKIPARQNVIRCPPVNWAKYHIVGGSLDKMHEAQRRRPNPGEPLGDEWRTHDHVIAAPYSPFDDRFNEQHPMQTRKGSKKPA